MVEGKDDEFAILSLWRVDPVGGEFLDWPSDLNLAMVSFPTQTMEYFLSEGPKSLGTRTLRRIAKDFPPAWIKPDELTECERECGLIKERVIVMSEDAGIPRDILLRNLDNLIGAIQYAQRIPEVGVSIT